MYEPFERAGSVPQVTHIKLDKVIIEENDVTIQYVEGYLSGAEFIVLGANHVNISPTEYAAAENGKAALIAKFQSIDNPVVEDTAADPVL